MDGRERAGVHEPHRQDLLSDAVLVDLHVLLPQVADEPALPVPDDQVERDAGCADPGAWIGVSPRVVGEVSRDADGATAAGGAADRPTQATVLIHGLMAASRPPSDWRSSDATARGAPDSLSTARTAERWDVA
jgi:hypothetical protein